MYFHLIILAFYTVFLGCLTANSIHTSSVTPTRTANRISQFNVSMRDQSSNDTLIDENDPTFRIGSYSVSFSDFETQFQNYSRTYTIITRAFLPTQLMCISAAVILLFSGMSIIKEFFLMYQQVCINMYVSTCMCQHVCINMYQSDQLMKQKTSV